ncbi:MAG: AAA family ATPase [Deltaproteobacteria bacterium]
MISQLKISGFKSLKDAVIPFGALTAFIGANASGKSNALEAIRVLQGLALAYSVRDVFDGRPDDVSRARWPGVRGGAAYACRRSAAKGPTSTQAVVARFEVVADVGEGLGVVTWGISVHPEDGIVLDEWLLVGTRPVFDTREAPNDGGPAIRARVWKGLGGGKGQPPICSFSPSSAILTQLRGERAQTPKNEETAAVVARALADVQFLDPAPAALRAYDLPGAKRILEHGELFASVVAGIEKDPPTRKAFMSWLQHLAPSPIEDLHLYSTELGQRMFGVREAGSGTVPALSLSDGTLRFAAIAAALFEPEPPRVLLLEEVENGVNATRLRLLVEMLRQRSATGHPQVVVTTHSPLLLAYLPPERYENVIWFWRDREDGATHALPVTQIPRFAQVVARTPLSELFAEGWLEAAL